MIRGSVDRFGQPVIKVVLGGRRRRLAARAVVDTGFNGGISVPVSLAVQLGLELIAVDDAEYADGRLEETLVFLGEVTLDGRTRTAEFILTGAPDVLLGTQLLRDSRLEVDFTQGTVLITAKQQEGSGQELTADG